MANFFKHLGKSPSQIHTPNVFSESLAETKAKGSYESSIAALKPIPYQAANKLIFLCAKYYATLYHGISAGLGLATVAMLAYIFSGAGAGAKYPALLLYTMFGLTFIILSALLIGIEIFKSSLAKGIFKNLVTGAKVKMPAVFGLVLVMLFSIGISALGGAVLSYEMNDKSTQISQNYSVQTDSLQKLHNDNLQAVNASIEAYKSNLNKGSYWAKYATREKLSKVIEVRNDLLASAKSDISTVQAAKDKEVNLNSSEGKNYAVISAIVVFVLELLSILAYWFQYVYHANCEKEAANFQILTPTVEVVSSNSPGTKDSELSKLNDLLQNLLNGNNNLQLAGNTVNPSSQKVGFQFTTSSVITCPVVNKINEGNKICLHCGKAFIYKHHVQKYCNEHCRITSWEQRTGKKFNKKKGGKN
jgi:hypothetical protein